jgi:hypothetical protein
MLATIIVRQVALDQWTALRAEQKVEELKLALEDLAVH